MKITSTNPDKKSQTCFYDIEGSLHECPGLEELLARDHALIASKTQSVGLPGSVSEPRLDFNFCPICGFEMIKPETKKEEAECEEE